MNETSVGAAEFKAKCLRLMDQVAADGKPLVITKHGKPLVKLVPLEDLKPMRGDWKGKVEIVGDLLRFDYSDDWEAI